MQHQLLLSLLQEVSQWGAGAGSDLSFQTDIKLLCFNHCFADFANLLFLVYPNQTQFMKKYMIQTLYMDAWDLGTFYIGEQLFLGVSQLGGKSFVIYKWDNEYR